MNVYLSDKLQCLQRARMCGCFTFGVDSFKLSSTEAVLVWPNKHPTKTKYYVNPLVVLANLKTLRGFTLNAQVCMDPKWNI